jgi:hypothetical protein
MGSSYESINNLELREVQRVIQVDLRPACSTFDDHDTHSRIIATKSRVPWDRPTKIPAIFWGSDWSGATY